MKPLVSCLIISSLAMSAAAQTVPGLVIGEETALALSDVASIRFDASHIFVSLTDGTLLTTPLQPLQFQPVQHSGIRQVLSVGEGSRPAYFDLMGRPVRSLTPAVPVIRRGGSVKPASAAVTRSVTAAVPALQLQQQGIAPMIALSRVDSLTFSSDQSTLYLHSQGVGNAFQLSAVSGVTFPPFATAVSIVYDGSEVSGVNPRHFDGVTIQANGAHVVVKANGQTEEVEYELAGTSADGSFKIYSDYKWQATLRGVSLVNPVGPAINSQTGKKGTIKSPNGTSNTLGDGARYATSSEDQKGCIFSEGQLIFNGKGTLTVASQQKHGICSDDYVSFDNGRVTVSATAGDAVHAKDSVIVQGSVLTLTSAVADGIDSDGPVTLREGDNGTPQVSIHTTGDGAKGVKTGKDFVMTHGHLTIEQSGKSVVKDGDTSRVVSIRAVGNISITGGTVVIDNRAEGGKTFSADGTVNTQGADVTVK